MRLGSSRPSSCVAKTSCAFFRFAELSNNPTSAFVSSQARPAWQFYLQVDGSTVWDVGGQVYALRQGHFLAVPPRVVHALRHRARVKHPLITMYGQEKTFRTPR